MIIQCLQNRKIELTVDTDGDSMPFITVRTFDGRRTLDWILLDENATKALIHFLESKLSELK